MLLASFTSCGFTNPETSAGHEGYVYESPRIFGKGGFLGTQKGPANFGFSFFRNEVVNVDMMVGSYPELFEILCKDKVNMKVSAQALISLKAGSSKDVVEKYNGDKWYATKVRNVFRGLIRASVQKFTSGELKDSREVLYTEVLAGLKSYLNDTPFVLEKVVIGNIDFPAKIVNEIENRVAMEEQEKAMEIREKIKEKEARLRVVEAKGIAEAQLIIDKSLTNNYLQYEAIKAQAKMADSPNHTTVYIPVGNNGIPIIRTQK